MFDWQFVRTTLLRSLGYALLVVIVCFLSDLFIPSHWIVSDLLVGVLVAILLQIRAHAQRSENADAELYKAHSFHQRIKIGNALQTATHVMDTCDHITDPEHQNCNAAMRMELLRIRCALGQSPNPEVIYGNGPEIQASAH